MVDLALKFEEESRTVDTHTQFRKNRFWDDDFLYISATLAKSEVFSQSYCDLSFHEITTARRLVDRQSFPLSVDISFARLSSLIIDLDRSN